MSEREIAYVMDSALWSAIWLVLGYAIGRLAVDVRDLKHDRKGHHDDT